jgi:YD repeat-containing protein
VYDDAGNLTQVTDPTGGITIYGYDNAGNQSSTSQPLGGGVTATTGTTYDTDGRVATTTDATAM